MAPGKWRQRPHQWARECPLFAHFPVPTVEVPLHCDLKKKMVKSEHCFGTLVWGKVHMVNNLQQLWEEFLKILGGHCGNKAS